MTICMMTMVHHTIFHHMKKMKTAIGSCSMGKQLSKKILQNQVQGGPKKIVPQINLLING